MARRPPARARSLRPAAASALLGALAALAAAAASLAADTVAVAVTPGEGFDRVSLIWPEAAGDGALAGEARIEHGVLVLALSRPIEADLSHIVKMAGDRVALARLDPGGGAARFALRKPARAQVTRSYNVLALDLIDPERKTDPAPVVSPRAEREAAAAEEARRRAAEAAANPPPAPPLVVRSAQAADYTRIIFDWPEPPPYAVEAGKGEAVLRFAVRAAPSLVRLRVDPPKGLVTVAAKEGAAGVDVTLTLQEGYVARDWRDGPRVVVDLIPEAALDASLLALAAAIAPPKPEAPAPEPAKPAPPAPAAPAKDAKDAKDAASPQPSAPAALAAPAAQETPPHAEPADGEHASAAPPAHEPEPAEHAEPAHDEAPHHEQAHAPDVPAELPAPAEPAIPAALVERANPVPAGGVVKAIATPIGSDLHLAFDWAAPLGAAAFRRGEALWVVFDAEAALDVAELRRAGGRHVKAAEAVAGEGFAALRLEAPPTMQISAAADDARWTFVIGEAAPEPPANAAVAPILAPGQPPRLGVTLPGARAVVAVPDKEAGDAILVAPAPAPARGLAARRSYVDVTLLASAQGLAALVHADAVAAEVEGGRVVFGRKGGLRLTAGTAIGAVKPAAPAGYIDFAGWSVPPTEFVVAHDAAARRAARDGGAAKLDLARLLVGQELGAEALGALASYADDEPGALNEARFRALRGAANALMARLEAARLDFNAAPLARDKAAALWRGWLAAEEEDWREARRQFEAGRDALPGMRPDWRARFRIAFARSLLALNDLGGARRQLDEALAEKLPDDIRLTARLLEARYLEAAGDRAAALARAREVAEGGVEPLEAAALAEAVRLEQASGALPIEEAIDRLETLRLRWRGDAGELELARTLGEIYLARGDFRGGLRLMRAAVKRFPKDPVARRLSVVMSDAFNRLYLLGEGERMDPVQALALWYEFSDLTPIGADGDRMIRRLADRLVEFDLLPQAAELLQHQVENRLHGLARAQVAADLAGVLLLDRRPEEALNAIRATRSAELPAALSAARELLEARALAELGRGDHALELLADDPRPEAKELKAEIAWKMQDWARAGPLGAAALAVPAAAPGALAPAHQRQALRAAIAFNLAGDKEGLAKLDASLGAKMAAGEEAAAWRLAVENTAVQGVALKDLARRIAQEDTLDAFVAGLRKASAAAEPAAKPPSPAAPGPPAADAPAGGAP